jgi:hypothetical protein
LPLAVKLNRFLQDAFVFILGILLSPFYSRLGSLGSQSQQGVHMVRRPIGLALLRSERDEQVV